MKIFLVITERDGATSKDGGKCVTELVNTQRRYAANSVYEVWVEIHNGSINLDEETIKTIHEEHPAVTVLSTMEE